MKKLNCAGAREIDLVSLLASLGHRPQKIRGSDHWFLSPLRKERTASFKVDRDHNLWYDHGSGEGGDLIDFGTRYYGCSIPQLLAILSGQGDGLPFHRPLPEMGNFPFAGEKKEDEGSILVTGVHPLADPSLLDYLAERRISLEAANRYCRELDFVLYGKMHTVIGFENQSGGQELRSRDFKGSSSPKAPTIIDNG